MNTWEKLAKAVDAARTLQVALFDVDGVLFPAEVTVGHATIVKTRAYYDGQGISILRAMGIRIGFITNEKGVHAAPLMEVIKKWNNLPSSKKSGRKVGWEPVLAYRGYGGPRKVDAAVDFFKKTDCSRACVSFMGDDIADLDLMSIVQLPVAPAQAEEIVREAAHFVTPRPGGQGAIRDFAEFVAGVRGVNVRTLKFQ